MAEARSLSVLSTAFKTGVAMAVDNEGVHIRATFTVPPPSVCFRRIYRKFRMVSRALYYLAFPLTSPLGIILTASIAASISAFFEAPNELKSLFNHYDYFHFDYYQLCFLSGILLTILLILCSAYLSRITLFLLLKNHSFLRERARSIPPFHLKLWFICVRALTKGNPLLFSFQSSLPRLPLPALYDTIQSYLISRRVLQTDEEQLATRKLADAFLLQEGPSLQWRLWIKRLFFSSNYVSDWWESYVYLRNREPLPVSNNFYAMDSGRATPTSVQPARAAFLTHLLLKYSSNLEHETIAPVLIGSTGIGDGGVPLCMNQIKRLFATSRIPGRDTDTLKHWPHDQITHCCCYSMGFMYLVQLIDEKGPCSPHELQIIFQEILADSTAREIAAETSDASAKSAYQCEASIPALTALKRSRWAEYRETLFSDLPNKKTLNLIEKALFYVVLSPEKPDLLDWSTRAKLLMCGDETRPGIFFDKSFCLTVFANGQCGINSEHSHSDAPITGHLLETILVTEHFLKPYDDKGNINIPPEDKSVSGWLTRRTNQTRNDAVGHWRRWVKATWSITRDIEIATISARTSLSSISSNLDLVVTSFGTSEGEFGKGFIKCCGVSPDAFIQLALQVASWKEFKKAVNTYESSMTRLFLNGRTETVRPCSKEAQIFVKDLLDESKSPLAKLTSLRIAAEKHVDMYVKAMAGEGIDRHLFALYVVSVGLSVESAFLKEAVSTPWVLSTSQVPQQQTTLWNAKDKAFGPVMSAGGGFGPACDAGYGVSYSIAGEGELIFHVSSSKRAGTTSASRFTKSILETLMQMKQVLAIALKVEKDEELLKNPPVSISGPLKQVHDPTSLKDSSSSSVLGSPSLLTPEPLLMSKKG
jgi:hypothetical protein